MLGGERYVADREIATAIYLSMSLRKPLLIEGAAGVGKTEVAKVMARALGTDLIRLQCYEGLDATTALYEWNYQKQLLHIRLTEASDRSVEQREQEIFSEAFLLRRPLLEAITRESPPVLLVDEVDRADSEFEAFLLEVLSDFQVTIPEIGTIRARTTPYVVLTSNRTRELGDALRRRCLYLWIDYPSFEKELQIVLNKVPGINADLAAQVAAFLQLVRQAKLDKTPGIAETIDWGAALMALHRDHLDRETIEETLGVLFKSQEDARLVRTQWLDLWVRGLERLRAEGRPWSQALVERVAAEGALRR
ncbi:MAG: MoxR family ATPase [Armatimonadota bacterium]|nr:MoxR family ATPase [Armatimonadota bacterium]MDR7427404.1 MoxR family ATPase [Armatimonadota bacterium]MDR7463839.1 MoxR family ATPase [Armatimonadota bacterium]MDR7470141.1 MoxR family ATPase [Armatimonadota bacterium]MDR7474991.1 MoxR family ATPase [Armatimonadota bacterium]